MEGAFLFYGKSVDEHNKKYWGINCAFRQTNPILSLVMFAKMSVHGLETGANEALE